MENNRLKSRLWGFRAGRGGGETTRGAIAPPLLREASSTVMWRSGELREGRELLLWRGGDVVVTGNGNGGRRVRVSAIVGGLPCRSDEL